MKSRVLIVAREHSNVATAEKGGFNVLTSPTPQDALEILMGGSSDFGKEDYLKTGKVRPQFLVLEDSFLDTYEGFELLELIRKYYSLQSVKIFIATEDRSKIDPAVFTRYKIAGVLAPPYNLNAIQSEEFAIPQGMNALLPMTVLLQPRGIINSVAAFIKGLVATKSGVTVAAAIAVSTIVVPGVSEVISGTGQANKAALQERNTLRKTIIVQTVQPLENIVLTESASTCPPDSTVKETRRPLLRKKNRKAESAQVAKQDTAVVIPVIDPQKQYKIVAVELPEE